MKKMLINATQPEELRVALVENGLLEDLDIERHGNAPTKANIYKGIISKVAPSLDAAFVDLGEDKHGFLPIKEIHSEALLNLKLGEKPPAQSHISHLKHALKEGQEILVQITKPSRGHKGAALTTFISLAGSYLVLMPNNPKAHGISRRIEGDERQALKHLASALQCPKGMGLIVRTAGVNKDAKDLVWDLESLLNYWQAILKAASNSPAPCLIHQEGNIVSRVVRDYLVRDIQSIIVDDGPTFESLKAWIQWFKPEFLERLQLYQGKGPLFLQEGIEPQIEVAFQREVQLPSGGSLSIDRTEALTAIDVNSARSTRGGDIEETATTTNLEAAAEIARQLRLRDLGGLIVIDFIDMREEEHQIALEERMRSLIKMDRARVQISPLSRFGLMEISRQRLRPSLEERSSSTCPRCLGSGSLRNSQALALSLLRQLTAIQRFEPKEVVCLVVPVQVATFLLNEKRKDLESIEAWLGHKVAVMANPLYLTPQYSLLGLSPLHYQRWLEAECASLPNPAAFVLPFRWVAGLKAEGLPSLSPELEEGGANGLAYVQSKQGMISEMLCATRAQKQPSTEGRWWSRIWGWVSGAKVPSEPPSPPLPLALDKVKPLPVERPTENGKERSAPSTVRRTKVEKSSEALEKGNRPEVLSVARANGEERSGAVGSAQGTANTPSRNRGRGRGKEREGVVPSGPQGKEPAAQTVVPEPAASMPKPVVPTSIAASGAAVADQPEVEGKEGVVRPGRRGPSRKRTKKAETASGASTPVETSEPVVEAAPKPEGIGATPPLLSSSSSRVVWVDAVEASSQSLEQLSPTSKSEVADLPKVTVSSKAFEARPPLSLNEVQAGKTKQTEKELDSERGDA